MSRNFIPALFAIGVGVFTGYYTFNPTFAQLQQEKEQARNPSSPPKTSDTKQGPEPSVQTTAKKDPMSPTQGHDATAEAALQSPKSA